jgi:hypothetical protein
MPDRAAMANTPIKNITAIFFIEFLLGLIFNFLALW